MLTVVTGPMFGEKSTEILRYVRRALRAHKVVQAWIPDTDTRSCGHIRTHSGDEATRLGVKTNIARTSLDILNGTHERTNLIVIDEVQFLDDDIVHTLDVLRRRHHVVAAGLNLTVMGDSFGVMHQVIAMADVLTKVSAICGCGADATHTIRKTPVINGNWVGGSEAYDAACYSCWREWRLHFQA
jgi:thymidine kinase